MAKRTIRRAPSKKRSLPVFRFDKLGAVSKHTKDILSKTKMKIKSVFRRAEKTIEKRPLTSFFAILALLLVLIIIGSFLRKPHAEKTAAPSPKEVSIYSIGKAPKITVQGKMEKSGIIKVVALTPGVISNVNVVEGQMVAAGTTLVSIGSNYSGGNAASVGREIAAATYQNVKDTYDTQKDLIKKQRELADKQKENADALRDITNQSLSDTRSLIDLNVNILSTLNSNLVNEQNGANDPTRILALKQQIAQYQSGITQLNAQLRSADYAANGDKPGAALSNISRDIAQKQLDIQEKAINLARETSTLSLKMAQVQEAAYFPSAPFAGVVERVYVTPGQSVNPGTPLLVLHGAQKLKLVVKVPRNIAQQASMVEESVIHIGEITIKQVPTYISTEATDGDLYSIDFVLPEEFQNKVTNNEYLSVDIPVGMAQTSAVIPFIPIDSVYQTESDAYIFVDKKGKAQVQKIQLGLVMGSYVEVKSGLSSGDNVILSRNVIAGDHIKEVK